MSGHLEIRYLTTAEAADVLSLSVRTLVRWRTEGAGPPVTWIRSANARPSPRYRSDRLRAWADGADLRDAAPRGPDRGA